MLREFFDSEVLRGPGAMTGPMVWGSSPELDGSGLGALTHAMRHVAQVGRPVGGSGRVPDTLLAAFEAAGGKTLTRVECLNASEAAVETAVELALGGLAGAPCTISEACRCVEGCAWIRT